MRDVIIFLVSFSMATVLLILYKIILDGVAITVWQDLVRLMLCCIVFQFLVSLWRYGRGKHEDMG